MSEPSGCELHDAAVYLGPGVPEVLLELSRTPIADECRICTVCRLAREYVEKAVDERSGRVFPSGEGSEAAARRLQAAVEAVKASHHRPPPS